jgi:hypothetical protein
MATRCGRGGGTVSVEQRTHAQIKRLRREVAELSRATQILTATFCERDRIVRGSFAGTATGLTWAMATLAGGGHFAGVLLPDCCQAKIN